MVEKSCYDCFHYRHYYRKGQTEFIPASEGFCWVYKKCVSCTYICDCWKAIPPRDITKIQQETYKTMVRLANSLDEIKYIVGEILSTAQSPV